LSHSYYSVSVLYLHDLSTTEIFTLSLHDALPISSSDKDSNSKICARLRIAGWMEIYGFSVVAPIKIIFPLSKWGSRKSCLGLSRDRKSTRLNSSHVSISYAVFCLKKKRKKVVR